MIITLKTLLQMQYSLTASPNRQVNVKAEAFIIHSKHLLKR